MFEHKGQRLLSRFEFFLRLLRSVMVALGLVTASLFMGAIGYHYFEKLPWIDAVLNASMILTGMGPVDRVQSTGGKVFATGYALFSGVIFLTLAAVLFAPVLHRMIHRFHLETDDDDRAAKQASPKHRVKV